MLKNNYRVERSGPLHGDKEKLQKGNVLQFFFVFFACHKHITSQCPMHAVPKQSQQGLRIALVAMIMRYKPQHHLQSQEKL